MTSNMKIAPKCCLLVGKRLLESHYYKPYMRFCDKTKSPKCDHMTKCDHVTLQVRAKYMTLDPAANRYVKYIRNIRTIQVQQHV